MREENALELQIDGLTSLERIDRIAVAKLKMAPPTDREVLDLGAWDSCSQAQEAGIAAMIARGRAEVVSGYGRTPGRMIMFLWLFAGAYVLLVGRLAQVQ